MSNKINFIRTGVRGRTPIVFLHAVGLDLTTWDEQINKLHHEFDVIALDLPGHGLSKPIEGPETFPKLANEVVQFIEDLSLASVHLVGISFGGMIAQTVAVLRPDLISSLSLMGTTCGFTDPVKEILRERALFVRQKGMIALAPLSLDRWFTEIFHHERPDLIDRIKKILHQQDQMFHSRMWDLIASLNLGSQLQNISLPALIIVGSEDSSTPISSAKMLADALKTDALHIIPNSSHLVNLEAPEIVNQLLGDFLKSI